MLKKRLMSMLLVVSMLIGLGNYVYAAPDYQMDMVTPEIYTNAETDDIRVEKIDNTIFCSYVLDNSAYVSQLGPDGTMIFSYALVTPDTKEIYQSEPFSIFDIRENVVIETITVGELKEINNFIFDNLNEFTISDTYCFPIIENNDNSLARKTTINDMLLATFGESYQKKLQGAVKRTYDKEYLLYCYGTQTVYRMNYDTFDFAAQTALTTIAAWLIAGKFDCTKEWFVGAAGATIKTIDGIARISKAISGDLYYYNCNRIKSVTVPSYNDVVVYSASEVIYQSFMDVGGSWETHKEKPSYTQPAYNDHTLLFDTAFTRFVNNYLL